MIQTVIKPEIWIRGGATKDGVDQAKEVVVGDEIQNTS